ncbi:MAG TPA: radical SAM protein [Labilithrix sp.]|nr:radical SAM protein [Labilithrix sp.]
MQICLVNPRIPPAAMNFQFAMDLVDCAFSHIPLALCTLAALTPASMSVRIVDENVEPVFLDLEADIIAMTGVYCQRERLFELADAFRARGKRVAIGGPITADVYDQCRAHADILFIGEAEYTWPKFCEDLRTGTVKAEYRQTEFVDMRDSPQPRFDLLKAERYSSACIQATRGCPYRCEYCDVPEKQGSRPRSKPIENVLAEVRALVGLGFDSIFFVDDHFVGNRRYARELLKALAKLVPKLPLQVYFYTQVTLNIARDVEMLALFHAANFRRFFVGIETSDIQKLRAIDKRQNTEIGVREAIEKIQAHNITVWAGIIVGLDGDTPSTFDRQYEFISETGITPTLIGLLQAMPGAPLYDRIKRERRLRVLHDVVGSNSLGSIESQGRTNIEPMGMTIPELMSGFGDFVERVYDPDAYGDRLLRSTAKGTRAHPNVLAALTKKNAKIIARMARWYVRHDDPAVRRLLLRVLGAAARRRGRGLEELVYHLVIYKHLRTFYSRAASSARAAAARYSAPEVVIAQAS